MTDIKTVSVIPSDRTVVVNGEAYTGCDFDPTPGVQAIQWHDNIGRIEGHKGMHTPFLAESFDEILGTYLAAWRRARAAKLRQDHDGVLEQHTINEKLLLSKNTAVEHLSDHLAELEKVVAENPDDSRAVTLRAVATNDLERVKKEVATLQTAQERIAEKLLLLNERATQAENEATSLVQSPFREIPA